MNNDIFYGSNKIQCRMNERMVCLVSIFGLLAFHVFTYSYPFLPNNVITFNNSGKHLLFDLLILEWINT